MKSTSKMSKAFLAGGFVLLLTFVLASHAAAQTCVQPPVDLVSWWPGDGDADDIADANNGTLEGGATFTAGQVGQAFLLDGIDDFVDLGNASNLHVSSADFTVDAWVLFNALSHPPGANIGAPQGDMSIVDKMSASGVNTDGWRLLKQNDNRFWFCLGGGTGNRCFDPAFTVFSTTPAVPSVWFHVTAVKSSTSFAIYVNGVLEDIRSPVPSFLDTNSADLRIGSYVLEGSHLNGLVDEVEIYNRALTSEEIQAIFNAGSAGKCKVTTVAIDIKPGSLPNSINPKSKGVIPVAILTTGTFDATTVDSTTVRFGATGTEAAPVHSALEDVDGDGDTDLILHFNTQDAGIQCGDTSASLTGETFSGQAIQGADSVNTVGCP